MRTMAQFIIRRSVLHSGAPATHRRTPTAGAIISVNIVGLPNRHHHHEDVK